MDKKFNVVEDILNRLTTYRVEERVLGESDSEEEELGGQDNQITTIKEEKEKDEAHDPMVEVNLGTAEKPRTMKISGLLAETKRE